MRRNNKPRRAGKHDELQAPKIALTGVDALHWPPAAPLYRGDGVGMLLRRLDTSALLARAQSAEYSARNAITAGITWQLGSFRVTSREQRAGRMMPQSA